MPRCGRGSASRPRARDLVYRQDRNGNQWAWWGAAGGRLGRHRQPPRQRAGRRRVRRAARRRVGVPRRGRAARARASCPTRSIAVVNFADEEGARFGVACVGSRLLTGVLSPDQASIAHRRLGTTLEQAMTAAGVDATAIGRDDEALSRIGAFVELHVEQGRALVDLDAAVGVATAIWPHGRWRCTFRGEGNHAGTTRLVDRHDPMLPYAATVLAAREIASELGAVATFGKVKVEPNGTNAIATAVHGWLDARAADEATLTELVAGVTAAAAHSACQPRRRGRGGLRVVHPGGGVRRDAARPARPRPSATFRRCRRRPGTTPASFRRWCRRRCSSSATRAASATARPSTQRRRLRGGHRGAGYRAGRAGCDLLLGRARLAGRRLPPRQGSCSRSSTASSPTCASGRAPDGAVAAGRRHAAGHGQRPLARLPPRPARAHPAGRRHVLDLARADVRRGSGSHAAVVLRAGQSDLRRDGAGRASPASASSTTCTTMSDGKPSSATRCPRRWSPRPPTPASASRCSTRATSPAASVSRSAGPQAALQRRYGDSVGRAGVVVPAGRPGAGSGRPSTRYGQCQPTSSSRSWRGRETVVHRCTCICPSSGRRTTTVSRPTA